MSDAPAKVVIAVDGPYLVSGNVPLEVASMQPVENGDSWEWRTERTIEGKERYALCRCGQSQTKPFCDGAHVAQQFDGSEVADRRPYAQVATTIDGPTMELQDAPSLCAYARFCDNYGRIWELVTQSDHEPQRETVAHEATHCPSGRLVVRDKTTGAVLEPAFAPSIVLAEDPAKNCSGPLWLRGNVPLSSSDGTPYETRNRVTLCRCGKSQNKPFCDGTHVDVGFSDGLS